MSDDITLSDDERAFEDYLDSLSAALQHGSRERPFRDYCTGLLLPDGRKSVEPMAARLAPSTTRTTHKLDFAHSIIGRMLWFQWLVWLSEAHTDISVHLMGLNPGPGHGGMSCTSPSKSTFSTAWHHNRNAKNAQSQAKVKYQTRRQRML